MCAMGEEASTSSADFCGGATTLNGKEEKGCTVSGEYCSGAAARACYEALCHCTGIADGAL